MANNLNLYDPLFYAQEALIALRNALGMAARVHRGYDKAPQQRGSRIQINRPGTFVAQDAPSTAQDLNPGDAEIVLSEWKEVKFALTDKELTFTGQQIINDHIRPAGYALANDIDQKLAALSRRVPWFINVTNPAGVADITAARRVLFNNGAPMDENDLAMMVDGQLESEFLSLPAFSQWQGAGPTGERTQLRGSLGTKFGFEVFANQNVRTHVAGVAADPDGTLTGIHAAGASNVTIGALSANATFREGDSFVIAGDTQRYVLTATQATDATGNLVNAQIFPKLVRQYPANAVVNFSLVNHVQNIAFHRHFAALAMAPLSTMGREVSGVRMEVAFDDITGLALRSRVYYMPDISQVRVALDVLYGFTVLEPNLAVVMRD